MIPRIILSVAMLDGAEYTDLRVTTADRMKLGEYARRQKWGSLADDTDRCMTYLAYLALARRGDYAGTFTDFIRDSEAIGGGELEDVDPTMPASPDG